MFDKHYSRIRNGAYRPNLIVWRVTSFFKKFKLKSERTGRGRTKIILSFAVYPLLLERDSKLAPSFGNHLLLASLKKKKKKKKKRAFTASWVVQQLSTWQFLREIDQMIIIIVSVQRLISSSLYKNCAYFGPRCITTFSWWAHWSGWCEYSIDNPRSFPNLLHRKALMSISFSIRCTSNAELSVHVQRGFPQFFLKRSLGFELGNPIYQRSTDPVS